MQRQRILFSSYRSDQYSDPEGYIANLTLVLGQYPDDVIIHITDPLTGIQRHCKWPPTISEIVEACDRRMQDKARTKRLQNWGRNEPVPQLEAPREDRPTYAELKAKFGDNFGLAPEPERKPVKAPDWDTIIAQYQADPERMARLIAKADGYRDDRGDSEP